MTRILHTCDCTLKECSIHKVASFADEWVDAITTLCRPCEIGHGKRWGHHGGGVQEGTQIQADESI